jgi:hypothetical protein
MAKRTKAVASAAVEAKTETVARTGDDDFPIVGIGASAGGLEALEQFMANVPADSGVAFIVIQHLDPNRPGVMPELLQRVTPMKVVQADDGMQVQPNCVYVIPPNKDMSILHGTLHLLAPLEARGLRLPIDYFFRALADDRGDRAIGVILSGMGSDGTLGLKAIKEKAGMVLVQDPISAKFDGMPSSAIHTGLADIVAAAEALPTRLLAAWRHYQPHPALEQESDSASQSGLDKVVIQLRARTGHDFSQYKKSTVYRRIERRMGLHQIDRIATYARFLQENPAEVDLLFKELLIGVTNFFRDPACWAYLQEHALPELLAMYPNGRTLRAWVPACSTGEEAYSLAIVFREVLEKQAPKGRFTLQVFRHRSGSGCHRPRPPGLVPGQYRGRCLAGAAGTLFRQRTGQLPGQQGNPRNGDFRAAERAVRPAVHQAGHPDLPQPVDLSGRLVAAKTAAAVPLQPQPERHSVPRQRGNHRRLHRIVPRSM